MGGGREITVQIRVHDIHLLCVCFQSPVHVSCTDKLSIYSLLI